jgi:hypothetical protein
MNLSQYGIDIDTNEIFKSKELRDAEKMYGTVRGKVDRVKGIVTSKADPLTKVRNVLKTINFGAKPNSAAGVIVGPRSNVPARRVVGTKHAFISEVPEQFRVWISNETFGTSNQLDVFAVLQENVTLSTRSHWETYNPLGDVITDASQAVAQLFRKSLVSRISSRRIWKGTEPVRISLLLKFEAYERAYTDVVVPNIKLQQTALPSGDEKHGQFALLTPPGPYPYNLTGDDKNPKTEERGENITVQVGNLFTFNRVVVAEINTVYSNKFDNEGYPVSAQTQITFDTYEILTKNMLGTAYTGGSGDGLPTSKAVRI